MNHMYSMSTFIITSVLITLLLTVAPKANADSEITWQDIVTLVDKHPQIGQSKYNTEAARAAVEVASAISNPTVKASTAYGQASDNSASKIEWGVSLSIPLGWAAQRNAKIDEADALATYAKTEEETLRRDVLLQLRILFWSLVYEQAQVAALSRLNDHMNALTITVNKRVKQGEVRPVEATQVEVEAEIAAGKLDMAGAKLLTTRHKLAAWLNIKNGEKLTAKADLKQLPLSIPLNVAVKRTLNHPKIKNAHAQILAGKARVKIERKARVPSASIEIFADHELDRSAYGLALAVKLPVWNWNTGNIKRAENLLAAKKKQLDLTQLNLETLAMESQLKCQAGVKLSHRYNEHILPKAESFARVIERTYQLGESTLLEVINARRTLLETQTLFLSTLAQAQIDCSQLSSITGETLQ